MLREFRDDSPLPANVIDLGGPIGGRFWTVTTDHAPDHPDAQSAAIHARVLGCVGATCNDANVIRYEN